MSRLVVLAFGPEEVASGSALGMAWAAATGGRVELLLLTGEAPATGGFARVMTAGLEEIPPAHGLAEALVKALQPEGQDLTEPLTLVALSSMRAKDVLARVTGLWDGAMVTDVLAIEGERRFVRPMVAGAVLATVEVDPTPGPLVLTYRPAGFRTPNGSGNGPTEPITLTTESSTERVSVSERSGARPELGQARVVVSGGRPLRDAATFEALVGGLADTLGGAVGATRAAVDSGIAPNELQVGQTGKIVAPDLYIAAGISGSTQHMAGIKDSRVIVAINLDADAPIFEYADYGWVTDLYDALPQLRAKLAEGS